MDHRVKTAALAVGVCLLASTYTLPAMARSATMHTSQDQSAHTDEYLTPAQRNPELPKGLTIVPWKLERRADRIDLLNGTPSGSGASTRAGQSQPLRSQPQR